ncbi:hypothetical protein AV521_44375 [Streptomyces sp. IMTB 2501]|uniref:hypothetical protein n=1 Tax=Streptomyces sp. IMTB 2501 TaxID=1776340 RepID=UPI00096C23AE|nr:hypothetical protein [Streptomyces sp. IMTB 2501]OLZ61152.1 hypothetical protein AV521_44375 [Streptomyces sp. IMTB 2501]
MRPGTWSDKTLPAAAGVAQVRHRMRRPARGAEPAPATRPARALACDHLVRRRALRRYRSWLT